MNVSVMPGELKGKVRAVPSKSMAQRLLICASLADEPTLLKNMGKSKDIEATMKCLKVLGAEFVETDCSIKVIPIKERQEKVELFCEESGATLRMMLPVCAALTKEAIVSASGSLQKRPIEPLLEALEKGGKRIDNRKLPIQLTGELQGNHYEIVGNVSSQFVSGLLLMSPLLKQNIIIDITTEIESLPYINMTCQVMELFGIEVECQKNRYIVYAGKGYHSPGEAEVEGDWSNASYYLVASAMGADIVVEGLSMTSCQADRQIVSILPSFGYEVKEEDGSVCFEKCETVSSAAFRQIDLKHAPDLLPALTVMAGKTPGITMFRNLKRQRYKESDRIASCAMLLMNMGRRVQETDEELIVTGGELTGGTIDSCNDHRIVMAATIAATMAKEGVAITGAEAVEKSYPQFFYDIKELGGKVLQWT